MPISLFLNIDMASAQVSLSWAPGVRLVTNAGESPEAAVDIFPTLPAPFLKMFFAGHHCFVDQNVSIEQASTEYQAIMATCGNHLKECKQREDTDHAEQYDILTAEIQSASNVWSFIHAVYIMSAADRNAHISSYLSDWYRANYSDTAASSGGDILTTPRLSPVANADDDQVWQDATKLILQGNFSKGRDALTEFAKVTGIDQQDWRETTAAIHLGQYTHVAETASPIILVGAILEAAPDHNLSSRADNSWQTWQEACTQWLNFPAIEASPGAQSLLRVVAGDPETIAGNCTSWQEMLVAMSLYLRDETASTVGGNLQGGLSVLAQACAHASCHFDPPSAIAGGALLEAAMGNLRDALVRMHATLSTPWFSTHLCDVLVRSGNLQDVHHANRRAIGQLPEAAATDSQMDGNGDKGSTETAIGMREAYFLNFSSSLERYRGCWRLAVDYLRACPTFGTGHLSDLLGRTAINDGCMHRTAEKMLTICRQMRLHTTGRKLCERVGVACLHNENLSAALAWFARGGLKVRCRSVADLALTRAEKGGPLSEHARTLECVTVAISSFGDRQLQSELDYITMYYDMQEARAGLTAAREHEDRDDMMECAKNFAKAVSNLIDVRGVARQFVCVIAYEAGRLLEMYPELLSAFSRRVLLDLLGALEIVGGKFGSGRMVQGLRCRISYDGAAPRELVQKEALPCSVEKAEGVVDHLRKVFVQCLARKINES